MDTQRSDDDQLGVPGVDSGLELVVEDDADCIPMEQSLVLEPQSMSHGKIEVHGSQTFRKSTNKIEASTNEGGLWQINQASTLVSPRALSTPRLGLRSKKI